MFMIININSLHMVELQWLVAVNNQNDKYENCTVHKNRMVGYNLHRITRATELAKSDLLSSYLY